MIRDHRLTQETFGSRLKLREEIEHKAFISGETKEN